MFDFLTHLFDTTGFPPRWNCGDWTPGHGWLHILSDLGVWSAYVAIPCVLGYFVLRRKDIPFRTIFLLFGAFILACGTTHLMEVLMFWWPAYRLAGVVKLFTAVVSWGTVLALVPVTPKALAMRSPEELEREIAARKKAEHALQKANAELREQVEAFRISEERFRLLVDGTRDYALFMLDPSGRVALWNLGAQRIKQYRADEIVGQHVSRFYTAEDIQTGKPETELRVAEVEGRYEEEGWRLRKDGSRFWANVVITALRDEGGHLRGFSKITRDITERKEAEENARRLLHEEAARRAAEEYAQVIERQREQLRVTLTSIGDAVITTDVEGRVTLLNPVAESLTGWTSEDAAGQPLPTVFQIINEKTRQKAENPVARVIATGHIVGLANHTVLIAKDGTEQAIDDSAAPIRTDKGAIAGVVLVFRDVTEQRKTQQSARLLASIVESSDDAIIGKDSNGIITSWNQGGERIFGYTAAEAVGCPIAMLAPPDRVDETPRILERIGRGERVDHFDTLRRAKDGRLVPVSLTVSPIRDEDGEIIGASKIARDISERKRAERALREEKAWLQATMTGIGDAVIATDAESRVTMMNPVARDLTGWREEATGHPLDEILRIINEQTHQPVESPVSRVIREGTVVGLANHTALVSKDGTVRPIEDSAAPIRGEHGQIIGVVLVFRDATQHRQAEAAVRESQRREKERADVLEAILRATPTPIWIAHDPHCHRITGNAAALTLVGLPEGSNVSADTSPGHDPSKRGFREYQGDEPIPVDELPMQRAVKGEAVNGAEVKYVFDDGGVRYIYGNAVPLRNLDGSVRGCVAAFVDVTPLKEADELLRQSEQRLAAELDAMSRLHALSTRLLATIDLHVALDDVLANAIATCGADFGNIQLYNPQLMALEIVAHCGFQQDFLDHFRTVRVEEGSACAQAMQSGERIVIEDVELDPGFEPHRPVAAAAGFRAVQSTPLKSRAGSVLGMLSTHFRIPHRPSERDERLLDLYARHAADLIERIRIEQALEEADRRKNEFLATLGHELRNPLAPIRNAAQILKMKGPTEPDLRWGQEVIDRQVQHMARLLDDLLDVSRITHDKLELRKERIELAAVVQSAVETSRPLIDGARQKLTIALPQPVYLDADPVRLGQVFSNLLNNASKYSEPGGLIQLTGERQGSDVVVSVKDEGMGIAAEMLPRLFDIFSQAKGATQRSQSGLGIGLSLVKGLIELHGGRIEAHSEGPNKGSEFIVRLPIVMEKAVEAPPSKDVEEWSVVKCRLLIVDDLKDSADSLAMLLRMMGHEVHTAYDGEDAILVAEKFKPEVVLLDIGMPKLNGCEACRRIRQQPWGKEMYLIALTGWGQEDDRRRTEEAGFNHHLLKPVDSSTLLKMLAELQPKPR